MSIDLPMALSRTVRTLLRAPGFSLSVIMLIALSVGGAAAIASAGWSLFLKPLPYANTEQLVDVSVLHNKAGFRVGLSAALVQRLNDEEQYGTLAIVERPFQLRTGQGSIVRAGRIDHRLLNTLGITPLAGRGLHRNDMVPGAEPVVLISRRFWINQFGGDPAALGQNLELEDGRRRVVGILPDGFAMPESITDLWLPMDLGPEVLAPERLSVLLSHRIVARIPEGQGPAEFQERLLARFADLERLGARLLGGDVELQVRPLRQMWSGDQGQALLILGVAAAVVLLATWLNLAGLWLARWAGRTHALAIQLALGAGSGVAGTGVVLEYLALAVPGLLLAAGVSGLCVEALYSLGALEESGPLRAGSFLTTLATGALLIASGLVVLMASLYGMLPRLAQGAAGNLCGRAATARPGGLGLRRVLMTAQIAIAFTLMLVLALLFASWLELLDEDTGFDRERLAMAMVGTSVMGDSRNDPGVMAAIERMAAIPGVENASWANVVPFGGLEFVSGVMLDDQPDEAVEARARTVGPGFFETAGIQLIAGRGFGPEDAGEGVRTVIVDRAFEQRYLDDAALGRRVGYPEPDAIVVGVVESVRHESPDELLGDPPTLYRFAAVPAAQTQILVRSAVDPESIVAPIQAVIEVELGEDRFYSAASLESRIRRSVSDREPQLILIGTFAGLALVLVFYGLYALQSYQVASGTAEIGLRRALGASRPRIVGAELARAARLLPPGLVLGMLGGWFGMQLINQSLYKVGLVDPAVLLATGTSIALTILLAGLLPALRASRIEPLQALRHE